MYARKLVDVFISMRILVYSLYFIVKEPVTKRKASFSAVAQSQPPINVTVRISRRIAMIDIHYLFGVFIRLVWRPGRVALSCRLLTYTCRPC